MKGIRARDLDTQELLAKKKEMEEQMFRLRFQMSMGQTDGLKKVRSMKKDRARVLTELRSRELTAENK